MDRNPFETKVFIDAGFNKPGEVNIESGLQKNALIDQALQTQVLVDSGLILGIRKV